jgi:membrane protein
VIDRAQRARSSFRLPAGGLARHLRELVTPIAKTFAEHNLLTNAAAIAFQMLISLVPLTLLGLGILGATGHREVWTKHVAPAIQGRLRPAVYHGIDDTVRRILDHGTAGLIAFSAVLSVWYLTAALRAVIESLNRIHDVDDDRPWWKRAALAAVLGSAAGITLYGAAVLVIGGPRGVVLGLVRWVGAVVLLGFLVGLLVRYAPAQQPRARWASLGAVVVVGSWIVASIAFRLYVTYLANFKTPIGTLTSLLVLTSYLFVSAIVFLAGVQIDEVLRKRRRAHSSKR